MVMTNVAKFAAELKMPADVLLEQLKAAGVTKSSPDDALSEADKERLLTALRASVGTYLFRITIAMSSFMGWA